VRVFSPATWVERRDEYDRVSKRVRLGLTPDLTIRWATGNDNYVYSSLWDFKSSFTCRKILRHGTFPLYFPSETKVCCGYLSPIKIHRFGRVLNPQPLGAVASTLTTTPPRRLLMEVVVQRNQSLGYRRKPRCNRNIYEGYSRISWSIKNQSA
jgi:hypothetical protein